MVISGTGTQRSSETSRSMHIRVGLEGDTRILISIMNIMGACTDMEGERTREGSSWLNHSTDLKQERSSGGNLHYESRRIGGKERYIESEKTGRIDDRDGRYGKGALRREERRKTTQWIGEGNECVPSVHY